MALGFPIFMDSRKTAVKITGVAKAIPQYHRETPDILPLLDVWLEGQEERFVRKVKKIFTNAAVDKRYSIMAPEEVFTATSFEDKNDIYSREVIKLGEQALTDALKKTGWDAQSLDYIITVSCTGIMIPSLEHWDLKSFSTRNWLT